MRSVCKASAATVILASLLACIAAGAQTIKVPSSPTARARDVSMDDYRQHLAALSVLVDACAKNRNTKSCDPALIGPDDRVPIVNGSRTEQRLVRFGWLRVLFSKAQDPDLPVAKTTPKKLGDARAENTIQDQPPTSQLLKEAKLRLDADLAQSHAPVAPHPQERDVLQHVLSEREFRGLQQTSVRQSVLEKFGNWLNRLFESAANLKARSAWVGRALVWGFILAVCVALVYSLLRLERRWRVQLTQEHDRPAPGAPSARDWQLWLEDARKAAASGLWREAIHFVYWAAISRLEARRLWPADRARTPREYLALVAHEDPRKPGLSQLTGTFERFWYGGRPAGESDYKNAEILASALIAGSAPAGPREFSAAPEGGAR
ncbi:MAG TPA: DUF4129 domain-containing protein [Terracidiphilus sp.]|nr:DUF4129 domain-containing protein [Terracidiphilus sp.]